MKQVVQTLQLALEKEKTKVKDLKEQVKQGSRMLSGSLHLNFKLKFKCSISILCFPNDPRAF